MEVHRMDRQDMNTTTKLKTQVALLAIMALVLLPTIVLAHGGEEHVIGTVTNISDTSVTVKTTAGKGLTGGVGSKNTVWGAGQARPKGRSQGGGRGGVPPGGGNEKRRAPPRGNGGAQR